MKRAAQLLLLLLSSWLLSAGPSARFVDVARPAPTASSEEGARPSVEHAVAEHATVPVARAPLLSRLPAPPPIPSLRGPWLAPFDTAPPDLREAVRRVQTRRRLPRLTPDEPPWC